MKVLAIDYGERHLGLAVGDTEHGVAMPFGELEVKSKERVLSEIENIVVKKGIERLVIGMPLNFKMRQTATGDAAKKFGNELRKILNIPVDFENEILSSLHAARFATKTKRRKSHAVAAALILESWLARNKGGAL